MRHYIFKDKDIPQHQFENWMQDDKQFWEKYTLIKPSYTVIEYNFDFYATEFDSDGDVRPKHTWLQLLADDVKDEHGKYGADHVLLAIHEDNWRSSGALFDELQATRPDPKEKGIWGTNYSNIYNGYHLHYCRWHDDNRANTIGTFYHERLHSFDALIKTELGINIAPILGVQNYDAAIVHGKEEPWQYVRYKENVLALETMAPYLRSAYGKRIERHERRQTQWDLIDALGELVHLYRELINRKVGVPRGT